MCLAFVQAKPTLAISKGFIQCLIFSFTGAELGFFLGVVLGVMVKVLTKTFQSLALTAMNPQNFIALIKTQDM